MNPIVEVNVQSEIGKLNGVILHTPGEEVENMTPENAERALYSDIINLSIAREEYKQISGVLSKITKTYQVKELLCHILQDDAVKTEVINRIERIEPCIGEKSPSGSLKEQLLECPAEDLSRLLIEGVEMTKDNLTKFSVIMQSIFDFTPEFKTKTLTIPTAGESAPRQRHIEGGDVLIARDDILLIGNGARTSTQAIDMLIYEFMNRRSEKAQHIIVQQLPLAPESFIHLDMVFTLLDRDKCMVFAPLILNPGNYQTVHIKIQHGKLQSIRSEKNLLSALKKLGMDLEPVLCGGTDDWNQEREQWHSGANFFAVGPGQVLGYARNTHTMEAMNNAGFEILKANDVLTDKVRLADYQKYVITIEGSELPRGGGGARCMTMPVNRDNL